LNPPPVGKVTLVFTCIKVSFNERIFDIIYLHFFSRGKRNYGMQAVLIWRKVIYQYFDLFF
jgi:hypothetical protein